MSKPLVRSFHIYLPFHRRLTCRWAVRLYKMPVAPKWPSLKQASKDLLTWQ